MKHNKTNEKGRTPGLYPVSVAQQQEEKGTRERSDITREDKDRHNSNGEDSRSGGGQNNPTAVAGRTSAMERERRGGRASFGGYQGL